MVQNNKVLTVSYGTFSCTLEGFDDSFGTMKAIAEYFRDLASDDRYFGAEPPQPDAEMLARIAQREVARQVEARTSADGIHLRAATLSAPDSTPETVQPRQPTPGTPERHRATGALSSPEAAAPVSAAEPTETVAPAAEPAQSPAPKPLAQVALQPIRQSAPAAIKAPKHFVVPAPGTAPDTTETTTQPIAKPTETTPPVAEVAAQRDEKSATAESIAAKLRRIRAVVAQTPTDEFNEDQHAEQVREDAVKEITNALSADHDAVGVDQQDLDEDQRDSDEAIADALNRLDLGGSAPAPVPNVPEGAVEFFADSAAPKTKEDALDDQPDQDETADRLTEVAADDDSSQLAPQSDDAQSDDPVQDTAAALPKDEDPQPRKRGRVLRVKRREFDAAMAKGNLEEVSDTAQGATKASTTEEATPQQDVTKDSPLTETAPRQPAVKSSLSPDDEAELLAELAAVEADLLGTDHYDEMADDFDDDDDLQLDAETAPAAAALHAPVQTPAPASQATKPISTPAEAAASVAPQARDKRGATSTADSDIARLMAATDERLDDPENTTSRETYSQLRAVMAAASAERSAGGALENNDDAQVYRDDLASVVRPRRPEARAASAEGADQRPAKPASRPAPLKLVQEQRIDDADTGSATPVRPRRVSAAILAEDTPRDADGEGGFTAYVEKTGAVELSELLEAAAAYMSFVERRDHFSRPQLMNKVRGVDGAEFNREDGLRSFGQLLREGKIERADNGRFTASGQIGFQPGNRAAG
ncbi:chemotaxis protein CheA [Phaeobacter porticola]